MEEEIGCSSGGSMATMAGGVSFSASSYGTAVVEMFPSSLKNRQRFTIELKPEETTIVSWKKLVKEANKFNLPASVPQLPTGANPALESRIAPFKGISSKHELKDPPPSNRFSAVIEKIERLYVGNQSSDEEELGDAPDDDQYDTEDSFIDDIELDEYFEVDKSTTKHEGFFVNRGKLEHINEPTLLPDQQPKKRRKDLTSHGEEGVLSENKHAKMGHMRMKAAARNAPRVGKRSSKSQNLAATGEFYRDKTSVAQSDAPMARSRKKCVDLNLKLDVSSSAKSHIDASVFPSDTKDGERQRTGVLFRDTGIISLKVASECSEATRLIYQDNYASSQLDLQSKGPSNYEKEMDISTKTEEKEKNVKCELPDLNLPTRKYPPQATETPKMHVKEGSCVRPKGAMLQRAIRELEKIVAESRPPTIEVQETDTSSQFVKRRLPREVKQKLAKVARLAQSSQGRISEDLITQLMGILGHIMQVKTLKRNLKEMVELGLSAKQEKDDKLQQIKKEVVEMIKMRVPSSRAKVNEQQDRASNDLQEVLGSEEKGVLKGRYGMDNVMEDKICDLYDQYVEGMYEDKGPLIRKLYIELAELWPNGAMDDHGIKNAICRAKARKRAMYSRLKNQEKIKQQKLSAAPRTQEIIPGEAGSVPQPRAFQEKMVTDSGCQVLMLPDKAISSIAPASKQLAPSEKIMPNSSTNSSSMHRPKPQQKVRGSPSSFLDEAKKAMDQSFLKSKLKRKAESELGIVQFCREKLSLQKGKEKHKSYKRAMTEAQKPSFQLGGFPGLKSSANML